MKLRFVEAQSTARTTPEASRIASVAQPSSRDPGVGSNVKRWVFSAGIDALDAERDRRGEDALRSGSPAFAS